MSDKLLFSNKDPTTAGEYPQILAFSELQVLSRCKWRSAKRRTSSSSLRI
ncbi:unnamed protein product [Haemonchus placei]|uniref:Uncharacterized protein n=1 Tax=Haemonchus placei TaxID=6290 RepID=A0A3P7W4S1_HAEPC|nr:unnamed protein product [Haemonchus placei]